MTFLEWLKILFSGRPHETISRTGGPYLLRWKLIPHNRWCNVFLHKFLRDDHDEAFHCHPWWFFSVVLWGSYLEHMDTGIKLRRIGSLAFRRATHRHQVKLPIQPDGTQKPCWTFIITGPKAREWGFYCKQGFVHWRKFVLPNEDGTRMRGCDQ